MELLQWWHKSTLIDTQLDARDTQTQIQIHPHIIHKKQTHQIEEKTEDRRERHT